MIPEWGRSPEEGMATHSSILAWRFPWTEEPSRVHGVTEAGTTVSNTTNMIVLIFSSLILKTTVPKGCQTSLEFKGGHKTMDWGSVALEIDKNRVHL